MVWLDPLILMWTALAWYAGAILLLFVVAVICAALFEKKDDR